MKACALGAAIFFVAPAAGATCFPRPTDDGGYQGYEYAPAEAKSFTSARVTMHWAASGKHSPDLGTTRADGVPDTIAYASEIAEEALTRYAQMGYRAPPPDEACSPNGGDDKLDIYLVRFNAGDGTTTAVCTGGVCPSFVLVDSTFKNRGYADAQEGFRTVVSHELFHTVQNAYKETNDAFWAEGTAQWAMKTLHPELQDFERQLPAFFAEPSRSIDAAPNGVATAILYGSAVWPLFLAQRHGADVIRQIFEEQGSAQSAALVAIDAVLQRQGSSLALESPVFAAWNAATGKLAGTRGYPDGAKYPGETIGALAEGTSAITSGLGAFAYRGTLGSTDQVTIATDSTRNAGVLVPIVDGTPDLAHLAPLPATSTGDVLVVVAGTTTAKTDAPFTLHIGPKPATKAAEGCNAARSASTTWLPALVLVFLLWRRR